MEAEKEAQVLALFDLYWFHHMVLAKRAVADPAAAAAASVGGHSPPPSSATATDRRSLIDEIALATASDSALLAHLPSTNHSSDVSETDKPTSEDEGGGRGDEAGGSRPRRWRRARGPGRRGRAGRMSLPQLEQEELQGLRDLGFTLSAADADERLLSIVPGLRGAGSYEDGEGGGGVPRRPYLSEAWEAAGLDVIGGGRDDPHDHLLRNWRVPAAAEGVDMKVHLRYWAHVVASAARSRAEDLPAPPPCSVSPSPSPPPPPPPPPSVVSARM